MRYLSRIVISNKGQHVTMVQKNRDLMAVMWVDRHRMYFVSTTGTSDPGERIYRERWRYRNGTPIRDSIEIYSYGM